MNCCLPVRNNSKTQIQSKKKETAILLQLCLSAFILQVKPEQYVASNIYIYNKLTNASALRGGSMKKRNELKMTMKMLNTISDLQESPFCLTSLSPSSLPVPEDASSSWSIGLVKNPYAIPVKAAPKCVLQINHPTEPNKF